MVGWRGRFNNQDDFTTNKKILSYTYGMGEAKNFEPVLLDI